MTDQFIEDYKRDTTEGLVESLIKAEAEIKRVRAGLSALIDAIVVYQFSPVGSVEAAHAARDLDDAVDAARCITQQLKQED